MGTGSALCQQYVHDIWSSGMARTNAYPLRPRRCDAQRRLARIHAYMCEEFGAKSSIGAVLFCLITRYIVGRENAISVKARTWCAFSERAGVEGWGLTGWYAL